MAVSVDQLGKLLVSSRLFSAAEIRALWSTLPADDLPKDGDALARLLLARGKLTDYQLQELLAGRGDKLVLGEYVLQAPLGEGGMGHVFKALHRRMERTVALKVLSPKAMKDAASVRRFQREVQAAASLEHPHIVKAYDAGEEAGRHFLVMQFVDGCDLTALVERDGPLPIDKAVEYVAQAAEGLAFAHGEGIVHRDIKPANLLVDKKGLVRILDMGLARIEGVNGLTATEQIMGTVDYMSPEQASDTKNADARSDVYSLGCTLWFVLTGKKVYNGDSMIARLVQHRDAPLPSLTAVRPEAGAALEQIVHRMIAKRPDERFATMIDVLITLAPYRGGGGAATPSGEFSGPNAPLVNTVGTATPRRPPPRASAPSATRPSKQPRRTVIAAGAAVVAIIVVGAVAWSRSGSNTPPAEPLTKPIAAVPLRAVPPKVVQATPYLRLTSPLYQWTFPQNLGPNVNGDRVERAPSLSTDGLTLMFASDRPGGAGGYDLWESTRADPRSPWRPATWMSPVLNTPNLEEHPSLSADGLTLLFTRDNDLWMAVRRTKQEPWPATVALGSELNTSAKEGGADLSPDGLTLYFHSDRPGGLGSRDLYVSRRRSTTAPFGPAESLGGAINSDADEERPTVSSDGLVLVFGSQRPGGEGGWDLYVSTRKKMTDPWSPALNLGPVVNSQYDDANAHLSDDGRLLFFRSNRSGGLGVEDLWLARRLSADEINQR